jgi:hypothetical protein
LRHKTAILATFALFFAGFPQSAKACAACRNPSMPVVRGSEGELDAQALRFNAGLSATTLHVVHEAGCADLNNCDEVPVQSLYLHDQHMLPVELRLSAEYAFSELFGVEVQLPLRMVTARIDYTTPDGAPYEPLDPDVHHRDETLFGLADPWLLARFGAKLNGVWLAARPGVSLPLGRTEEDPYALGDRGIEHQHIQFGTGTFDPLLVLEANQFIRPIELSAFAQAQASLYENQHGYRGPWRAYLALYAGTDLIREKLSLSLGPEVLHESAETWNGQVRQDGNLGRTEVSAAVTLSFINRRTTYALSAHVPLYRHIVEGDEPLGTLQSPLSVTFSVTSSFFGASAGKVPASIEGATHL